MRKEGDGGDIAEFSDSGIRRRHRRVQRLFWGTLFNCVSHSSYGRLRILNGCKLLMLKLEHVESRVS
jgi:hypothetical protein